MHNVIAIAPDWIGFWIAFVVWIIRSITKNRWCNLPESVSVPHSGSLAKPPAIAWTAPFSFLRALKRFNSSTVSAKCCFGIFSRSYKKHEISNEQTLFCVCDNFSIKFGIFFISFSVHLFYIVRKHILIDIIISKNGKKISFSTRFIILNKNL